MYQRILFAAAVTAVAGCGVIDPNITDFNLDLPKRTFTIDTDQWDLAGDMTFPAIPCSADQDMCSEAVAQYCGADQCTGACVADTCEMTVQVSLWRPVDLYIEKPELQTIDDQPIVSVTIDSVYYEVSENTLNFDTPTLDVFVAPKTVMNPADPQAERLGVIPSVPASSQNGTTEVEVTPEGEQVLRAYMSEYRTPFNIIVGTRITVQAGDPMPSGRIVTEVGVKAHAGL